LFSATENPAEPASSELEFEREPKNQISLFSGGEQPPERAKVTKTSRKQSLLKESRQKHPWVIDFFHE